jgi:hypothetical protein
VETLALYAGVGTGTLRRSFAQVELDGHEHGRTDTFRDPTHFGTAIRLGRLIISPLFIRMKTRNMNRIACCPQDTKTI